MFRQRHRDRREHREPKRDAGAYIGRLPDRGGEVASPGDAPSPDDGPAGGDAPGGHREPAIDRDDIRPEAGERR